MSGVNMDITESKQNEEELSRAKEAADELRVLFAGAADEVRFALLAEVAGLRGEPADRDDQQQEEPGHEQRQQRRGEEGPVAVVTIAADELRAGRDDRRARRGDAEISPRLGRRQSGGGP